MRLFVVCYTALCLGVLAAACSSPKPAPASPPVLKLWGDLKPVVSVKELMRDMIDPASDVAYWYPGEAEYLKKLDLRLEELYGIHADRSRKLGMDAR